MSAPDRLVILFSIATFSIFCLSINTLNLMQYSRFSSTSNRTRKLVVITWNVWFDRYRAKERYSYIFQAMDRLQPDVMLFQEVTPYFVELLATQHWIERYTSSDDLTGATVDPYGVLTLCKKDLSPRFEFFEFPTHMDRKLLICTLERFSDLTIGNVHLESLGNAELREQQLQICSRVLSSYKNSILCGDFNFCSYRNFKGDGPLENNMLSRQLPGHCDMWPALNPSQDKGAACAVNESCALCGTHSLMDVIGYTFDSEKNAMLLKPEQMRYDRVLYKFSDADAVMTPVSIELIGDVPVTNEYLASASTTKSAAAVFPSDHFGLLAVFGCTHDTNNVCTTI